MHTDDHILEAFIAARHPLPAIAAELGMTLVALVRWVDRNTDLLAMARRAIETQLAFLALHAEAVALADLTSVTHSTNDDERKRKGASQLLRHTAKRLFPQRPQSTRRRKESSPSSLLSAAGTPRAEPAPAAPRDSAKPRAPIPSTQLQQTLAPRDPAPRDPAPRDQAPPLSERDIDTLMATLATHFNLDLSAITAADTDAHAASAAPLPADST